MNWLGLFKLRQKATASIAKERLQLVVAHQRRSREGALDFLPRMQQDLLAVVRKYVKVSDDAIRIDIERDGEMEVLELNIVLPDTAGGRH